MSHFAYYNDNDVEMCEWLSELKKEKLIPDGQIDSRSILDVRPEDLKGFSQWHFFAGIGGWPFALRLAGWKRDRKVCTGSCPCQPFSAAGKGEGFEDPRHLWPWFYCLICECGFPTIFGEQVASDDGDCAVDSGEIYKGVQRMSLLPIKRDQELTPDEMFALIEREELGLGPARRPLRMVEGKVIANDRVDPVLKMIDDFSLAIYELKYFVEEKSRASAHMKAVGLKAQLDVIVKELGRRK